MAHSMGKSKEGARDWILTRRRDLGNNAMETELLGINRVKGTIEFC